MAPLFRIKICGITSAADGSWAAESGADAVGLNFVPSSPRCVTTETARRIVQALPPGVRKVGVFVNSAPAEILQIASDVGLDTLQLHGDEPPEDLRSLADWPLLRAFRIRRGDEPRVEDYLARCRAVGRLPDAVLVDAWQSGAYGGTGRLVDWGLARELGERLVDMPLILAGGLTPDNVADAIQVAQPAGVDTASGVESRPGQKDPERVRAFVVAARQAFARRQPPAAPQPAA
jgi:phosphoribosylanthranilate isomerase